MESGEREQETEGDAGRWRRLRERETDHTLIKLLTWLPNKCPCSLPVHIGILSSFLGRRWPGRKWEREEDPGSFCSSGSFDTVGKVKVGCFLVDNITKSKGTYRKLMGIRVPRQEGESCIVLVFSLPHFKVYFHLNLWCSVLFRMPSWLLQLFKTCKSFVSDTTSCLPNVHSPLFFVTNRAWVLFGTFIFFQLLGG